MDIEVRSITDGDVEAFRRSLIENFGGDVSDEEGALDRFRDLFENSRTFAAFDGGEIVGTAGAFSMEVAVPGGTLPMAGTTIVSVRPTHRRRGILRALMRGHLDEARDRGDPLVGLWASETPIYSRFGFGSAADLLDVSFDSRAVGLRGDEPTEHVRLVGADDARKMLPDVYEQHWRDRPGMLARGSVWWEHRHFHDPERDRDGASARRYAIAFEGDRPTGYVTYRQKSDWGEGIPNGRLEVVEMIGLNPEARRALWHLVGNVDLYPNVKWWNAPVDFALPWEVANPRAITRKVSDSLWLRLHDVPAALQGRTYAADGVIKIHVVDPFCHWAQGTFSLEVEDGAGSCTPTSDHPDVTLPAHALGALYLGGRRATMLARAGLVEGADRDVLRLGSMFSSDVAPWCQEIF
jgi:predicted acetyltransferase